ncbi:MAG: hypothetical protein H7222_13350 [Methylotenera sp.]|nr:hypothetical protein [Oligoflexia bacterium]
MDILGHSSLLVAVTSFTLGFSVLARNVRNKLFIAFAVVCTLISIWATSFFLDKIWPYLGFYRLHLLSNVWLAPAVLSLIRLMLRVQDGLSRRLLDVSFIFAVVLSAAIPLGMQQNNIILQIIYFSPGFIVMQTLWLMWLDRGKVLSRRTVPKAAYPGFDRRQFIYLGGILVLATSVMDHVPWAGKIIPVAGNLLLPAYLFFISQAISQQRLLNFNALFSRFLVLIAVALTLTAIYSLLVAWIENSPGLFFLNSFIASFIILTLLDPLRAVVRHFTRRLLTQKNLRLEQVIRESQRKLAGTVDPRSLFETILDTVELTLEPQWAAVFILKRDGTQYRRIKARTIDLGFTASETLLQEMLVDHPLFEYCQRLHKKGVLPVLLDQVLENEMDRSATRLQREYFAGLLQALEALGSDLLIPLFDSGQMLGFVAMRVPNPPEPWGSSWGLLQTVYPYFEQAARILRTMEVYVRQREIERLAALGEMAAGLAHEIRNPLGAIKGAAQFLDPTLDRPESKFLKVILEETDRLNRVVTQFLDYSKPHSVDLQRVDVSAIAQRTVELLTPTVPPGISLQYSGLPSAFVLASGGQIQQVLVNLIQNSFKALEGSERTQGHVLVSLSVEPQGREVILFVEDDGKGIKRENLDKLFIPFFTTSPSGTGLGLSICQKIVEAHRGRMEVQSEEGRSSRFTVILPLSAE